MIFLLAGHHLRDSGAVANGRSESKETISLRNLIKSFIPTKIVVDDDHDNLATVLQKIQTGNGSVVLDLHFNAAVSSSATGIEVLVGDDADKHGIDFAVELHDTASKILGIKGRGVKRESSSHRGRLGIMREHGQVALLEVCFISNSADMQAYDRNKDRLAQAIAGILLRRDALI